MSESAKRHEENSNLIKEIRASTDAAIRNQGASIKTLEIQIGQMSKLIQTRYAVLDLTNTPYPLDRTVHHYTRSVPFPSRLDNHYCEEEGNYGPKFTEACGASHINNAIPRKEKDPGSFTLPCFINDFCFDNALVDLGASVSVMSLSTYLNLGLGELAHTRLTVELTDRTITLRVGEEKIAFTSVKSASSLIKRVYMLNLRERMDLDLEARLMGETLVLNRSLDPFLKDYIELNDLNEPFELRRNQRDNLMPTIKEENMDAYRDEGMNDVIFGEPFLIEVDIKAKRFEGMITLYKGDEVNEKGMMHGVSHAYHKLKGFYKGVLKLGSDYIHNAKIEEWLTRGYISVRPREGNIDEYWWRIYESGNLEVLES
ncbi:mitochondrial proton/calcium exchanger protein-like protein isoform X1 [Tanacetum coccineum]